MLFRQHYSNKYLLTLCAPPGDTNLTEEEKPDGLYDLLSLPPCPNYILFRACYLPGLRHVHIEDYLPMQELQQHSIRVRDERHIVNVLAYTLRRGGWGARARTYTFRIFFAGKSYLLYFCCFEGFCLPENPGLSANFPAPPPHDLVAN